MPLLLKRAGQVRQGTACSVLGWLAHPSAVGPFERTCTSATTRELLLAVMHTNCFCRITCRQASLAGRDNFLAVEADRALAALVAHGGEARVAAALLAALSSKSPDVRAKAGMHLDACVQQHGTRLVRQGCLGLEGFEVRL